MREIKFRGRHRRAGDFAEGICRIPTQGDGGGEMITNF